MNYSKAISYLNSFTNYERLPKFPYRRSFKLARFKNFLASIDNPQKELKVIHVVGSKGKGSVCAFITYILKESGFKVGLYTSPHLSDFRERIRILQRTTHHAIGNTEFEGMISKKEICELVCQLKPSIDAYNKILKNDALSFFEVYTALAIEYFKKKEVDFVVLEAGLGGRLDATNTCSNLISIITPISYEHTTTLGKTLRKIAYEKSCIIKQENKRISNGKIIALTSRQKKVVEDVIKEAAQRNNALLLQEGRDFRFIIKDDAFDYEGLGVRINNLAVSLSGRHQIANASLAIAAVGALRYHSVVIGEKAIREGLKNCLWPARFEIVSKNPLVVLDGAQNAASMEVLRKAVNEIFPGRKIWLIFGISKDKELKDTCQEVEKITDKIILSRSVNPRASQPKDLLRYFKHNSLLVTKTSKEALKLAKTKAKKKDVILVTGSLFLCGEMRELIKGE